MAFFNEIKFSPGEVVFKIGDNADKLYFVKSGPGSPGGGFCEPGRDSGAVQRGYVAAFESRHHH